MFSAGTQQTRLQRPHQFSQFEPHSEVYICRFMTLPRLINWHCHWGATPVAEHPPTALEVRSRTDDQRKCSCFLPRSLPRYLRFVVEKTVFPSYFVCMISTGIIPPIKRHAHKAMSCNKGKAVSKKRERLARAVAVSTTSCPAGGLGSPI